MKAYLYVTKPVASLQFDIETTGTVVLSGAAAASKSISTNRTGTSLRVLIFGLNQTEFFGLFATVSSPAGSVSGIVGARADASDAAADVARLHQVPLVTVVVK